MNALNQKEEKSLQQEGDRDKCSELSKKTGFKDVLCLMSL